jgi:demethylmenaquinone methyltransferase/2-methoxy-6-polyprenyl-1,4-benzoquinol methylase
VPDDPGRPDRPPALAQQIDYYRSRAAEYDQWFNREGRYDRGPELNARWFSEVEIVAAALERFRPAGDVLELACGTGLWTERLARHATRLTAVDASPEMLELNRQRLGSREVEYLQADLFTWEPPRQFDIVFFSFWLSHVPEERFEPFWALVRRALRPDGRVFLLDSRHEPTSTAVDHQLPDPTSPMMTRRLNDGREFQIYKIFHEPAALETRLQSLGWSAEICATPTYFLYGTATFGPPGQA